MEIEANSDMGYFIGLDKTKPMKIKGRAKELQLLNFPLVQLYQLALDKKTETFNQLIRRYLINKRQYIIDKKQENNFTNWLDISCIAIASFANDLGLDINIESDYIPECLYKKQF